MVKNNLPLTIELVPETSWFTNLRSLMSKEDWDRIRRSCYRKANYRCEICGGKGEKWPVECHEVWEYDTVNRVQKLIRTIALCPACHQVKHIGLAEIRGKYGEALDHFCKVNQKPVWFAEKYINEQFDLWRERSQHEWNLNLDWLKEQNVNQFTFDFQVASK